MEIPPVSLIAPCALTIGTGLLVVDRRLRSATQFAQSAHTRS